MMKRLVQSVLPMLIISVPMFAKPAWADDAVKLNIDCGKSDPGAFKFITELGRLKVHDDLVGDYGFLICEEKDSANDTFVVKIQGTATTGTFVEKPGALQLAQKLKAENKPCMEEGAPYGPQGPGDKRRITYLFCQKDGKPDTMEVHVTVLKSDATPYPEKILSAKWPQ